MLGSQLQDLLTLFLGLIVEAFPFVVLGTVISALIGVFVDEERLHKYLPHNRILRHLAISLLGFLMPVCECGNIPIVRRLLDKGFSVSQALTFLLAAPILNPITIFSTAEAFKFDLRIVWARVIAAFLIANIFGLIISYKKSQHTLLNTDFYHKICEHHDHHRSKTQHLLEIFQSEFFTVMKMLIIGAFIAAVSQSFIPRNIIVSIGSNEVFSILAMLLLAFIVSICANIDAFFALSYLNTFSLGSLLTFMVFGPMVDIKILAMLRDTLKPKLLIFMIAFVALTSFLTGLVFNFFAQ